MGDVTAVEYMSLNGVVQAPGFDGEDGDGGFARGGWTRPYFDDHRRCMTTELEQALLHPVAVGSGKRLFPDDTPHPTELHLVDSAATEQGLLLLTYRRRSTGRR